jgi:hypothetical protein
LLLVPFLLILPFFSPDWGIVRELGMEKWRKREKMVSMAFNRWVCRPRIVGAVAVLSLAYYAVFMGGVPRQWTERFGRKGEAIDESLRAVLNGTLGVSLLFLSFLGITPHFSSWSSQGWCLKED